MNAPLRNAPIPLALANTVTEANYPREAWWMAARSEEVTRRPLGLWMLDEPIVLYRRENGEVVALDNRCPHRWAPLSNGKLVGDDIACPYHGLQFNAEGRCTHIPSQTQIPSKACVKSYPVIEAGPTVWLWMGTPEKADPSLMPDVGWLGDEKWKWVSDTTVVHANYRLLKENVLDLTHIPHVHPVSIGATDWTSPPEVTVNDLGHITYTQHFPAGPLAPPYRMAMGVAPDRPIARKNYGTSFTPAYHQGFVELVDPDPQPGQRSAWTFTVCHITTPVSPTEFVYRWYMGWDIDLSPEFLTGMHKAVIGGYQEDKEILESVPDMVTRDPRGMHYPEVLLQADQAPMRFRRKLDDLLAKERTAADPR